MPRTDQKRKSRNLFNSVDDTQLETSDSLIRKQKGGSKPTGIQIVSKIGKISGSLNLSEEQERRFLLPKNTMLYNSKQL